MKVLAMVGTLLIAASAAQATFSDTFESYTSTANMLQAGNWGDDASSGAPATLVTTGGNPGKYMNHPGGLTAKHIFSAITPTDAEPLVLEFDIYDDGLGNKRVTAGLRTNGGGASLTGLLEFGRFNALDNPEGGGVNVSGYGLRTAFVGGPAPDSGWICLVGNPAVQVGWHRMKATVGASTVTLDLDFGANGSVDATRTVNTTTGAGKAYNIVRLGGPSDNSSAGGALGFDNINLYQVPEPATLALLVLGGLFLRRRSA